MEAEREQHGSPAQDLESAQYVSICVDSENLGDHFAQVRDKQLQKLLTRWYGLDLLHDRNADLAEGSNVRNGLIVFGTLTNWKAYQMLKLYKLATALVASSDADEDILVSSIFDEVNCTLATFKGVKSALWSTYQCLLRNERA